MSKQYLKKSIRTVMLASSSVALAFVGIPSLAQDNTNESSNVEEVVVIGVRSALETALEVKRNSSAIVDHISSDDISGFPALDLGETLQAIPGIQLNRDSERRQSEISLRGFSGGFVLSTVAGHEYANPTRSQSETAPNPFGSFESSVFSGVTVYKSQQADLVEGGIAGVIDKQLPDALSKSGAGGSVTFGYRYEELNDSYDPEYNISGHTFLIEDRLAVAFKLAGSDQTFRRDVIVTPQYDPIAARFTSPLDGAGNPVYVNDPVEATNTAYAQWAAVNGISAGDSVVVPSEVRQVTEANEGKRISFTGNIGLQATEALKLTMDVLYTQRDMDKSEMENLIVSVNKNNIRVRPISDPILVLAVGQVNDDDVLQTSNTWFLPDFEYENATTNLGNREFDFLEQSQGVFLGAEWVSGALTLDSNITLSKASNDFVQVSYSSTLGNVANGDNGINGVFRNRGTDIDGFFFSMESGNDLQFLDYDYYTADAVTGDPILPGVNAGAVNATTEYNGAAPRFGLGANAQTVDREMNTFDLSALYEVDAPFITSVKGGVRLSADDLVSTFLNHSLEQASVDLLSNDLYIEPYHVRGTDFFNGKLSDYVTRQDGWVSLNVDEITRRLQSRGITPAEDQVLTAAGFIAKTNPASGQAGQNFDATQDTAAVFIMGNIDQDIGGMSLTGNVGVRHIATEVTATALKLDLADRANQQLFTSINKYSHTLPSVNLNLNVTDDVVFRLSANRGLTRPNLKGVKPSLEVRFTDVNEADPAVGEDKIAVKLPDSQVVPFVADSVDLTFEWYNREGSNIGMGLFHKKFKGSFDTQSDLCPDNFNLAGINIDLQQNGSRCEITSTLEFDFGTTDPVTMLPDGPEQIDLLELSRRTNSDSHEIFVGAELFMTQNLDFLPAPWNGLGMNASYTHLDNRDNGDAFNVSKDSFNVVGYWENEVFSSRLSYNYRSDYRLNGGGSAQGREERIVKGRAQVDLNLTYNILDELRVTFSALNMTDVKLEEHDYRSPAMLRRVNYDGRMYVLKTSFSF